MKKRSEFLLVIFLSLLALTIRLWRLDADLLIHYDQGLHAFGSWQIWHERDFKLLGHPTDVSGIFHGPFFYLLMSIPYMISGGNPVAASAFQIILEIITLPLFYLFVRKLANQKAASIALLIYAFSAGLVGYSRWLSNVTPILPFTNLMLYFISLDHKRQSSTYLFIIFLSLGLISQLNGAVGFTLLVALAALYRARANLKNLSLAFLGIIIPALPLVIFELRHNFVVTSAILNFSGSSNQGGLGFSFSTLSGNLKILFTEFVHLFTYMVPSLGALLLAAILYSTLKQQKIRFLLAFIFVPLLILSFFNRGAIGFFLIYSFPVLVALVAIFISSLPRTLAILILGITLAINVYHLKILTYPNNGLTPIGTHNILTVADRRNVIDWIYQQSSGENFSVWIYTIPYYLDEPWTYFFDWYGQSNYGYLPELTGGFSPNDLSNSKYFYAIYEPDYNKPHRLEEWLIEVEKNFGPVDAIYSSHDAHVTRHLLNQPS